MPERIEITYTDQHGQPGRMELRLEPNAAELNLPGWGAWLTHEELAQVTNHGTDVTAGSPLLHRLAEEVETRRMDALAAQDIAKERSTRAASDSKEV